MQSILNIRPAEYNMHFILVTVTGWSSTGDNKNVAGFVYLFW